MSDTVTIACPDCDKPLKIRAELEGKKVRCKDCGHTFAVRLPSAIKQAPPPRKAPAPSKPAEPKQAAPLPTPKAARKAALDEEFNDQRPYGMTEVDLGHRCPHCAAELESEDAIVCIGCGYNLATREHIKIVKTIENTGQDQLLWLLPGILCVVAIFALIGLDIVWTFLVPDWVEDTDFPFWIFGTGPVILWVIITSLFGMFYAARFAVRRLILNPTAPEQVKS